MDIYVRNKASGESHVVTVNDDTAAGLYKAVCEQLDFAIDNVELDWGGVVLRKNDIEVLGLVPDEVVGMSLSRKKEASTWLEERGIGVDCETLDNCVNRRRWVEVCQLIQAGVECPDLMKNIIKFGSIDALAKLMNDANLDINAQPTSDKFTALHHACDFCDLDLCTFLLSRGANISATQCSGQTPLHLAAMHGSLPVCDLLLSHSADPNALNNNHETPLHHAALRGHSDVVALLLSKGAHPNPQARSTLRTPLHYASEQCYEQCMRVLEEGGGNPDAKDSNGNTPKDLYTKRMTAIKC
eukprot:TRINITY_DN4940_c0_g1_i1.p1 TRINITY_DN4940_c0_g1~~TRINITY_DN4940_c0_g1_i1.p1  ORF type:complete len:318 (+),score=65.64 TRINITY_DN4940_c0_g1_i1:60-956(+)